MKIVSPFSKKEEVTPLIEAGADELYCGIVPDKFSSKYSYTLNRRLWHNASFNSFTELKKALQLAHRQGVRVFVTINGHYTQQQYPLIFEIIIRLNDLNVDGFIIADLGVLFALREKKIKKDIHIGTGGTAFNSRTVGFYRKLGASRVILPRHLTIDEIKELANNTNGIELETFILYEPCRYIDGFCTFHAPDASKETGREIMDQDEHVSFIYNYFPFSGAGCTLADLPKVVIDDTSGKKIRVNKKAFPPLGFDDLICGACAIYDFNKIGIGYLKIVGRSRPTDSKINGTKFIREVLNLLRENGISKKRFIEETQQLYCKTHQLKRCTGFNCYYPSVFNKKHMEDDRKSHIYQQNR